MIVVVFFSRPDEKIIFVGWFCLKPSLILLGSPAIQTANSRLGWKNIRSCNLQGF
jgi:hypothetical protein